MIWPYAGRRHADPVPGAPALACADLVVRYPGAARPALAGLTLTVPTGRRLALVGPNGAGKSTLLRAAAGLVRPAAGAIRIHGNAAGACHHRVAYLPQVDEIEWCFPMTVRRLVTGGRYPHLGWLRRPGPEDRRHVAEAIRALGLEHLAERPLARLSGGERQRVLMARALAQEAELLLLDEPLSGLDRAARAGMARTLDALAVTGATVIVATHELDGLDAAFDAVLALVDGRRAVAERAPETEIVAAWAG